MDACFNYLKKTFIIDVNRYGDVIQRIRPRMKCADGFEISVQASSFHYCEPRISGDVIYEKVELGYPSIEEPFIADYAEDDDLTNTVYAYVPIEVVNELIEKHGGIVE